jgi:transposase-like protein
VLSAGEQAVLAARARSVRRPYRDRLRAAIVLAAAVSQDNAAIARQLGVCTDTVRKWRSRFATARPAARAGRCPAQRAPSILYRHRPGRGHCLGVRAAGRVRRAAGAVERPGPGPRTGRPPPARGLGVRDPQFAAKAARVLDLYAGIWDGQPLGAGDYVICADEKTSIQARCRCHPTLPPGKARAIVDNGSSHRGAAAVERMASTWPNAQLIHLPAHASWLDQAETFFSVVQRKVLTPNDFTGLDQIRDRLTAFETRYNEIARPVHLEIHPHRPQRPATSDRRTRQDPAPRPGSLRGGARPQP